MITKHYKCNNCDHEFEIDVYVKEELIELRKRNVPIRPVRCKNCNSANIVEM